MLRSKLKIKLFFYSQVRRNVWGRPKPQHISFGSPWTEFFTFCLWLLQPVTHLVYPACNREHKIVDIKLESIQRWALKMVMGLEGRPCEEQLRALVLFSPQRGRWVADPDLCDHRQDPRDWPDGVSGEWIGQAPSLTVQKAFGQLGSKVQLLGIVLYRSGSWTW